ncbi:hypothetical protein TRIP_D450057 [uncultured Paludibacter sp.]|uniref:DUF3822 domain-containing protein n=1 Tax=uncultured Paludibacter sp. TaxID=497635 RepID=A0A653AKI3_9BACT|nr:hypothetical protein TRIP_D450057 [uncultured Paludibacter sp.]
MDVADKAQLQNSENVLDIFVSPEGIFCAVSDENKNVILRQQLNTEINSKTDIQKIEDFFNQPELDVLSENVNIYIENSTYQLIPSELYRHQDTEKLFEMTLGKTENETIQSSVLPKWNMHLAYRIPEKLRLFLAEKFPDTEPKHIVFDLLKTFIKRSEEAVYLNLRKNVADLALIKDNKLQLLNSFDVKTDEDIVYFAMNIFEQFQLNPENFKLKIKISKSDNKSAVELLKEYISEVEE